MTYVILAIKDIQSEYFLSMAFRQKFTFILNTKDVLWKKIHVLGGY